MACERIAVTNCALSSTACAVRIGYEGDAPIRDCAFNNLVIWDSHVGLDLISILPEPRPGFEIKAGARIEQIAFSDILMDRVERPIYLWMGNPAGGRFRGAIRGVSFSDVTASGAASSCLVGAEERWAEDIELRHVRLNLLRGRMPAVPDELDVWARTPTPYGLDCRRVRGLRLADVRIAVPPGGGWRSPLRCRQIKGLDLVELRAPGPELQAVKRLTVAGGQTDPGLARR